MVLCGKVYYFNPFRKHILLFPHAGVPGINFISFTFLYIFSEHFRVFILEGKRYTCSHNTYTVNCVDSNVSIKIEEVAFNKF